MKSIDSPLDEKGINMPRYMVLRAALADELGLEADRRLVGDDLHVMVGEAGEQRALGHLADPPNLADQVAFLAQRVAEPGDLRIVGAVREIEQDAVRAEIAERVGCEVADRGIGAAVEQGDPVIIGPDVHAPLVEADLRRHLDAAVLLRRAIVRLLVKCPQAVHQAVLVPQSRQTLHRTWLKIR